MGNGLEPDRKMDVGYWKEGAKQADLRNAELVREVKERAKQADLTYNLAISKASALQLELNTVRVQLAQVDDVLTVNTIGVKNGDYRNAIGELIALEMQIENDPQVSSTARARQEELAAKDRSIVHLNREISVHLHTIGAYAKNVIKLTERISELERALAERDTTIKALTESVKVLADAAAEQRKAGAATAMRYYHEEEIAQAIERGEVKI
jgi:hypothetical protein